MSHIKFDMTGSSNDNSLSLVVKHPLQQSQNDKKTTIDISDYLETVLNFITNANQ